MSSAGKTRVVPIPSFSDIQDLLFLTCGSFAFQFLCQCSFFLLCLPRGSLIFLFHCWIAELHFHSWFGKAPAWVDKLLFRLNTTFCVICVVSSLLHLPTHFHSMFLSCLLLTYFCAHILSQSVIDIGLIFSLHTAKGLLDKKMHKNHGCCLLVPLEWLIACLWGSILSQPERTGKEGDDFQPS